MESNQNNIKCAASGEPCVSGRYNVLSSVQTLKLYTTHTMEHKKIESTQTNGHNKINRFLCFCF